MFPATFNILSYVSSVLLDIIMLLTSIEITSIKIKLSYECLISIMRILYFFVSVRCTTNLHVHQLSHPPPPPPPPPVLHICVSTAPSHYLNQCWSIVNWTPKNKLQWKRNLISSILIKEMAFESVVWEMAAILYRPQCVKLNTVTSTRP